MRDSLSELHPSRMVARRMHELETDLQRARMHLRRHNKSPETTGRWGLEPPSAPTQEEGWFITYLDMMTLLLVVMIVMLAFSGTLGQGIGQRLAGDAQAIDMAAFDTESAPAGPPSTSIAAQAPSLEDGVTVAASAAAPNAAPAVPDGPVEESGLLPGGSGLLPGHAGLTDTAAVSETYPGWEAPSARPVHPADVGPLPRTASTMARIGTDPPQAPRLAELYPGWSTADLTASFVGPRLPRSATSDEQALEDAASINANDQASEGEELAAGLALGDLGNDVEIVVSERSVSFRVNSEILFDTSQADLSRSGLSVLRNIVSVLSKTGHDITVEGHTDAVPVRRNVRYPSNWELSSARAGSVVRYLQANGIDRTRLRAIGYADTRPIGDNHTPEGRTRNRRVELVIEKQG